MAGLKELKAAQDLADVAALLGFKRAALAYILYKRPMSSNYTQFDIKKRSGGTRQISAPIPSLKLLQSRLSKLLQNCMEEIVETRSLKSTVSHGFKRGRSIATNAKAHRRHRHVFNLDLEDFFGTINFGRVRGFFMKDKDFVLVPSVATVLAQIACFENSLPQGSPCSPVISNLVGNVLDVHLVRIALRNGCTYTRYADDLTFSTNKKSFPEEIAMRITADGHTWAVGSALARRIKASGFRINNAKTRMQYRDSRQEVTGIVINRRISVRREYRHLVRAMVQRLITTGSFEFRTKTVDKSGNAIEIATPGSNKQLRGMLGFIEDVDRFYLENGPLKPKASSHDKRTARELLYLHFLLYSEFYAAPTPVIICEGKTDNIYLYCAMRSLAKRFPQLAHVGADGTTKLQVRIFKYADTRTGLLLQLPGGVGQFPNFIYSYLRETKRFKAPSVQHPVIILIDNDSGAPPLYKAVKNITNTPITGNEPFIHVAKNVYLIATPLGAGGAHTMIEDAFDATVTSTILNGKKFAPENDFETPTHYSKSIFARYVVRPQWNAIDFSGFAPLLKNMVAAIQDFAKPKP